MRLPSSARSSVRRRPGSAHRFGGALIASLLAVMGVVGIASAAFMLSLAQSREVDAIASQTRSMYLAEAGLAESILRIAAADETGAQVPATLGTQAVPVALENGRYWADLADNGDGTYTVRTTGATSFQRFSLEALVGPVGGGVYDHAVFAGNSSEDPTYTLRLGGEGGQADEVTGDIFSGGDVEVGGDATVSGGTYASGAITGTAGIESVSRPTPDIAGMSYESNHDFDVASLFAAAIWQTDAVGGGAYQLPESNPAHIFRKNPSDRTDETSGTVKDDYFLEDPHVPLQDTTTPAGESAHRITLSGTMGAPGPSGTDKVYFIDGNLWIHNKPITRYVMENTDPEGFRATFVVKGNIYFSDDIYMGDFDKDGVAFIAIRDDAVSDSGNVYLGDPRYGTVEYLETYLYAENDFYDLNLDADGSKRVQIVGNMTAGNHVDIQRDYDNGDGTFEHSRLSVDFDDRVSTGAIQLPGLPTVDGGVAGYTVRAWRRITP